MDVRWSLHLLDELCRWKHQIISKSAQISFSHSTRHPQPSIYITVSRTVFCKYGPKEAVLPLPRVLPFVSAFPKILISTFQFSSCCRVSWKGNSATCSTGERIHAGQYETKLVNSDIVSTWRMRSLSPEVLSYCTWRVCGETEMMYSAGLRCELRSVSCYTACSRLQPGLNAGEMGGVTSDRSLTHFSLSQSPQSPVAIAWSLIKAKRSNTAMRRVWDGTCWED